MTTPSTALSEAQKRMVVISTEAGDPVKYGNNPAELSGARYEMDLCLERLGAYELLIKHNAAAPLGNNMIATEDLDSIPFVTDMLEDPNVGNYTYRNPCPDTPTRIAATNAVRVAAGDAPFTGVPRLSSIPSAYLKVVTFNKFAVAVEDHAYALTQLSIFEDQVEARPRRWRWRVPVRTSMASRSFTAHMTSQPLWSAGTRTALCPVGATMACRLST